MGVRARGFGVATMFAFLVAPPAWAQAAPREVIVHLRATPDVTLEREDGDDWVEVCFAPCDMPFSTRGHYRVGGGIRDSEPFRLRETSPGLTVVGIEPRSRGAHAFGYVLIGIGSAMTFGGLLIAGIGASVGNCSGGTTRDLCTGSEFVAPGLGVAVVGVVTLVVGVDLVVVNSASRVHRESSETQAHDDAHRGPTLLDLPRRREDSLAAPSTGGSLTIFSWRF